MEAFMDGQTAGFALFLWIVGAPPLLLLLADWLERRRRPSARAPERPDRAP
jgi:hypothetical protein